MASFGGRWAGPWGGQQASNRLNIVIKMTVFAKKKMKYNHSKLAKKVKVWGVSCEFSLKKSTKFAASAQYSFCVGSWGACPPKQNPK